MRAFVRQTAISIQLTVRLLQFRIVNFDFWQINNSHSVRQLGKLCRVRDKVFRDAPHRGWTRQGRDRRP